MFRKMRRSGQQLPQSDCAAILKTEPRGVLAVLGEMEYPYAFPMDFLYDEMTNKLYFHCAMEGHKLDALRRHDKASFCVYDRGFRKDGHWSLNIRSVIVFGRMNVIDDPEEKLARLRALAEKYYPVEASIEAELNNAADRALCLALTVEHMTGKLVNES